MSARPALARTGLTGLAGLALAAALLGACERTGTITVQLATAPDSAVLDAATRVRLRLTEPPAEFEAERASDGSFDLALDVAAEDVLGAIVFEAYDAGGELVAYGSTPPLPIAGITADITLYAAAPMSMAATPTPLAMEGASARTAMGAAAVPYGALLVGGRDGAGAASSALTSYSVYEHEFVHVGELPGARVAPAVASGARDAVFVFGGLDENQVARDTLYSLIGGTSSRAAALELRTEGSELGRSGAAMSALGGERFGVSGDPAVLVDGIAGEARVWEGAPALAGTAVSGVVGGVVRTLFAGAGNGEAGAWIFASDSFAMPEVPSIDGEDAPLWRTGHGSALLPDGSAVVVGGRLTRDEGSSALPAAGVRVDLAGLRAEPGPRLATPRVDAAVAATESYLVVAGGSDEAGAVLADVELFAADDLAPVAVLPLVVPRTGAVAVPLGNGQVLIAGGSDASGAPVATAELFTPRP
ncbi:hypothetical protein [Haliangium ochraceum]|uniref:Kelch repeat-containing protein n=1 Tax=Haliangium ochraceum (strain DSM 14365 / JCM 11303 / SMP-2) TaxID=502025 RepID=D0LRI2_HALO1|nr:hypothetical protein [Haliangium ochraceum]ACY17210.1 hypothetical protein Hoch_4720 [Haliangium ochraceum DSM 14365]